MKKVLLISNLFTLALLLALAFYAKLPQKIYSRMTNNAESKATSNCTYALQNFDFHHRLETPKPAIVMMGNSLIRQGNWNQLLAREDVINRGIAGDQLNCICDRMNYLKGLNARIWFLEGGINDLPEKDPGYLFEQYKKMVEFTTSEHAIPVINLVFYLSAKAGDKYPQRADYKKINNMIAELNVMLVNYGREKNIAVIDMSKTFYGETQELQDEYTTDGVHLSDLAYKAWAEAMTAVLAKYKI